MEPALNGGLYTGEPFIKNAPWANVPVRPTAAYMTRMNLQSANPPIQALFQIQHGNRPGNNTDDMIPGIKPYYGTSNFGPFNFGCIPCIKDKPMYYNDDDCDAKIIEIP